jgi:hypothetical protein
VCSAWRGLSHLHWQKGGLGHRRGWWRRRAPACGLSPQSSRGTFAGPTHFVCQSLRSYARLFRASTFFAGHFSAAIFAGVDTCKNRRLREQWKEDDDVRKKVLSDECRERAPTRATIKKQQKLPLPMNFELFPCFALTHHEKPHSSAGVRTGRI